RSRSLARDAAGPPGSCPYRCPRDLRRLGLRGRTARADPGARRSRASRPPPRGRGAAPRRPPPPPRPPAPPPPGRPPRGGPPPVRYARVNALGRAPDGVSIRVGRLRHEHGIAPEPREAAGGAPGPSDLAGSGTDVA